MYLEICWWQRKERVRMIAEKNTCRQIFIRQKETGLASVIVVSPWCSLSQEVLRGTVRVPAVSDSEFFLWVPTGYLLCRCPLGRPKNSLTFIESNKVWKCFGSANVFLLFCGAFQLLLDRNSGFLMAWNYQFWARFHNTSIVQLLPVPTYLLTTYLSNSYMYTV